MANRSSSRMVTGRVPLKDAIALDRWADDSGRSKQLQAALDLQRG